MNADQPAGCPEPDPNCPECDFTSALTDSVSLLNAPQAANLNGSALAMKATANLGATILDLVKTFGLRYLAQIETQALTIYDQYIAPYDIPAIPNSFEPAFDGMLRGVIVQVFASLKLIPIEDAGLMAAGPADDSLMELESISAVSMRAAQDRLNELRDSLPA